MYGSATVLSILNGTLLTLNEKVPLKGGECVEVLASAIDLATLEDATTLVADTYKVNDVFLYLFIFIVYKYPYTSDGVVVGFPAASSVSLTTSGP